jgi:L-rhamnose mutarotase
MVIGVRPEMLDEYRRLHADAWPDVLAQIRRCHISNYSIFYRDGLLFGYLEYSGDDWDADMRRMAEDPATQRWWELTDPCQVPLASAGPGEHWAPMDEVFHMA